MAIETHRPIIEKYWAVATPNHHAVYHGGEPAFKDIQKENVHLGHAVELLIFDGQRVGEGFFDFNEQGDIQTDFYVTLPHKWERPKNTFQPEPPTPHRPDKPRLTFDSVERATKDWMKVAGAPKTREYALNGVNEEVVELFDAQTNDEVAHEAGDLMLRLYQLIIISGYSVDSIMSQTIRKLYEKYPPSKIAGSQLPFKEAMAAQKALWK